MVVNTGASEATLGGMVLIVTDRAGIFTAARTRFGSGEIIAPGASAPIEDPVVPGELPDCVPVGQGTSASEAVGAGGPYVVEVVLG